MTSTTKNKILISGTSTGLGKYLSERLEADDYNRTTESAPQTEYETIIHCATAPNPRDNTLAESHFHQSQFELCDNLVNIPHKLFILISCTDIYPQSDSGLTEETVIDVGAIETVIGQSKWQCETLVTGRAKNHLILRCSSLLGIDMRLNNAIRVLADKIDEIKVTANSSYNFITHEMVGDFIDISFSKQLTGIYNLAAIGTIRLEQIAIAARRHVEFGDDHYRSPLVNNTKAANYLPSLKQTSTEVLKNFWHMNRHFFV